MPDAVPITDEFRADLTLGAIGDPRVPDHVSGRAILLLPASSKARAYVNLRPVRLPARPLPVPPPSRAAPAARHRHPSAVPVRIPTERYCGVGGRVLPAHPTKLAVQTRAFFTPPRHSGESPRYALRAGGIAGRRNCLRARRSQISAPQYSMDACGNEGCGAGREELSDVDYRKYYSMRSRQAPSVTHRQTLDTKSSAPTCSATSSRTIRFRHLRTSSASRRAATSIRKRTTPSMFRASPRIGADIAGKGIANRSARHLVNRNDARFHWRRRPRSHRLCDRARLR